MKHKTASKTLSLLLALCMVVGLFPAMTAPASAAGDTVTTRTRPLDVTSSGGITDTNGNAISATDGVYSCPDEGWSYNSTTNELTLSGVNFHINGSSTYAIVAPAKITVADGTVNNVSIECTVSGNGSAYVTVAAINCSTETKITGSGSLTLSVTAASSKGSAAGIYCTNGLTLEGCNINIDQVAADKADSSKIVCGIYAMGDVTINPNAERNNQITIKNVSSILTNLPAIQAMGPITADGATASNTSQEFKSG